MKYPWGHPRFQESQTVLRVFLMGVMEYTPNYEEMKANNFSAEYFKSLIFRKPPPRRRRGGSGGGYDHDRWNSLSSGDKEKTWGKNLGKPLSNWKW